MAETADTQSLSDTIEKQQQDLLKQLDEFKVAHEKQLGDDLQALTEELKSSTTSDRQHFTQLISEIKTSREDNLLRILELREGSEKIQGRMQYCEGEIPSALYNRSDRAL